MDLWMGIFILLASSLPTLGEGGSAGLPPGSSCWAGYKGTASQASKHRHLQWSWASMRETAADSLEACRENEGDLEMTCRY